MSKLNFYQQHTHTHTCIHSIDVIFWIAESTNKMTNHGCEEQLKSERLLIDFQISFFICNVETDK